MLMAYCNRCALSVEFGCLGFCRRKIRVKGEQTGTHGHRSIGEISGIVNNDQFGATTSLDFRCDRFRIFAVSKLNTRRPCRSLTLWQ